MKPNLIVTSYSAIADLFDRRQFSKWDDTHINRLILVVLVSKSVGFKLKLFCASGDIFPYPERHI